MSVPRFLFLAATRPAPRVDTSAPRARRGADQEFLWRLVAGNNRLLGRSPGGFRDLQDCEQALGRLLVAIDELVACPGPSSGPGHWTWQLVRPGPERTVLAVSARHFERQREYRDSIENFRAAVPVAVVSTGVVVRPPSRPASGADLRLPPSPAPLQPHTQRVLHRPPVTRDALPTMRKPAPDRFAPAGAGSPLPPE